MAEEILGELKEQYFCLGQKIAEFECERRFYAFNKRDEDFIDELRELQFEFSDIVNQIIGHVQSNQSQMCLVDTDDKEALSRLQNFFKGKTNEPVVHRQPKRTKNLQATIE